MARGVPLDTACNEGTGAGRCKEGRDGEKRIGGDEYIHSG
jgi:hypothetical protein